MQYFSQVLSCSWSDVVLLGTESNLGRVIMNALWILQLEVSCGVSTKDLPLAVFLRVWKM